MKLDAYLTILVEAQSNKTLFNSVYTFYEGGLVA